MTKNDELVSKLSPAAPEAVHAYDAAHGKYACNVCAHPTTTATPATLPGAPNPFGALSGGK